MNGELFFKVSQGKEHVAGIKMLLVFSVAAFHFSAAPWSTRTNELVAGAKFKGSLLKKGLGVQFAVGEAVGKLKAEAKLRV